MMFKMMRSCVGVARKEKLWIYSDDYMNVLDDMKVAKLTAIENIEEAPVCDCPH